MNNIKEQIPQQILDIAKKLKSSGFDAYLVGGCVRDILRGQEPKDWDFTTNAKPEEIIKIFGEEDTFYENDFGTVGVKIERISGLTEKQEETEEDKQDCIFKQSYDETEIVEITPYRLEGKYSNARHPDEVRFSDKLEDDLKRRDFTVNALAYDPFEDRFVDLYGGISDLQNKILKAVGDAKGRFEEDALRMLRAIRLSAQLGFTIDYETMSAIAQNADLLQKISKERIRDEFLKIINSKEPMQAIAISQKLGLLKYIVPELEEGVGCEQGKKAHKYDVFEHLLRSLQHAADRNFNAALRLSALFHDIGKPRSRRKKGNGYTFYGHEVVGARMTAKIMKDLNMPKDLSETVVKLVRWHMFFSDPDEVTLSAVRRMIRNVGKEHIQELLCLRMSDRIGSGRPKEQPFRFRKYKAMVDEALKDPVSVQMLKIDGKDLMQMGEKPGPRIGWILHALLEEVLEDPSLNNEEYLQKRAKELMKINEDELKELGEKGKETKSKKEQEEIMKIYKKHKVFKHDPQA